MLVHFQKSQEFWSGMRVSLLGTEFDALTLSELCTLISDSISLAQRKIIANHNLHSIYLFHHDPQMRNFYSAAYKIHIDGMPLIYLARLFGYPIQPKHRVTYLDLVRPLMAESVRQQWRLFYLGGKPGVAAAAAERLHLAFPDLQLKTHHGYFKKVGQENQDVLEMIRCFTPNVLMVGMGMPLQEHWILENIEHIEANVILTSGACFDYIAGVIPSAPRWVGRVGLEWLFRLISEPKRLWRRYLLEPWYIAGLVLKGLFR
jgi:N-acetylglucosaminyldiphosphoundecaprenol N-acetyl-beta-D-mannosaminyltransferase